jgi:hypothetical protein
MACIALALLAMPGWAWLALLFLLLIALLFG